MYVKEGVYVKEDVYVEEDVYVKEDTVLQREPVEAPEQGPHLRLIARDKLLGGNHDDARDESLSMPFFA